MAKHFEKNLLPDPVSYFESNDMPLKGPGRWKTTRCPFHGGSDSMRVHADSGGWVCMNCHANGGDVIAMEMQLFGIEFLEAAERLGALRDDGGPERPKRKTTLSPMAMLKLVQNEVGVIVVTALTIADLIPGQEDRNRLLDACRAVQNVMAEVAA
jgi:hypothetical protein